MKLWASHFMGPQQDVLHFAKFAKYDVLAGIDEESSSGP
jgi:hypothetical protein